MVAGSGAGRGSAARGSGAYRDVVKSDFIRSAAEIHRLYGPGKGDTFRSPVAEIWPGYAGAVRRQRQRGEQRSSALQAAPHRHRSGEGRSGMEKQKAGLETARNVHYLA